MGVEAIISTQQGLAELAEWVEAHPGVGSHPHLFGAIWIIRAETTDEAGRIVLAMADGARSGSLEKSLSGKTFFVERKLSGEVRIQMQIDRAEVLDQATFDSILAEATDREAA